MPDAARDSYAFGVLGYFSCRTPYVAILQECRIFTILSNGERFVYTLMNLYEFPDIDGHPVEKCSKISSHNRQQKDINENTNRFLARIGRHIR
jgi:hypothetical protein